MALPRIAEPFLPDAADPNATVFHTALATDTVVSLLPSRLFILRAIVDTGVDDDRIVMAFDAIALPADGTEPLWEMFLPANGGFVEAGEDFAPVKGLSFLTGIVLAGSTTTGTLTVIPQNDIVFFGMHVPDPV